ncbi:MAG: glycosyltransferase family 4 protein [Chlorobiaceae bacterium]|nr:glycosyltransferase family 4 protein [Chlorobiaceae bacterium]
MKALRIAFITPFSPLKGGIARFSGLLREALCRMGYTVFPVGYRALYPAFLFKGGAAQAPVPDDSCCSDARLTLYNPFTWLATIIHLRRLKPDLLLVAYWTGFLAPLCYFLRRFTGIRVVVLLHNFTSHESFIFEPFMQRVLAASADAFLTLSSAVSRELRAVLPNARVLELFHPLYLPQTAIPPRAEAQRALNLESGAPLLLFFGYVRHYKGLDLLLRAMPEILQKEPSLKLIVAGEFFEDPDCYRSLIRDLGISASVDLYPGYVSPERSELLFAAAECVVLPYRSATQSGVVLQAYGYGVPVIVTPEGALPEVVLHGVTGWIARESSAAGLVEAVAEFIESRGELPKMRAAVEEYCREFSWESFAAEAGPFLESEALRK